MSMDQAQFEALVQRMERFASRAPGAYRWWVFALAVFGYTLLLMLVIGLLLLLALLAFGLRHAAWLSVKLGLLVGALLLVVLRSLWVRLEPPSGEPLGRQEAPAFFALLDRLVSRLHTARVHCVLITEDFNAAVMQLPRLGILGWYRNYLLIGLPLMQCLSVQQFEAVLAHELGHLSRGHARMGNWIYRLRRVWMRLDSALAQRPHWGSGAIRGVLHWYVPYFNACSFPLARRNEFEADSSSAQLTSADNAAQALTNVSVIGSYLRERYWPAVGAQARDTPQPAFAPYSALSASLLEQLSPEDARRWLTRALAEPTTYADTHPSLKERLDAMKMAAQFAPPAAHLAADQLLGERSAALAGAFDSRWREGVAASWKRVYEETQGKRARLAALRMQCGPQSLAVSEAVELADLEEEFGEGPARALTLRRELLCREPDSVPARFVLARQLLQQGDRDGVALMEAAMQGEADAVLPGCELLRDYWWRTGQRELARQWHERALQRGRELEEGKRERESLEQGNVWLEHRLEHPVLQALVARLRQIEGLKCAYLVRKHVVHDPHRPLYVLGFGVGTLGVRRNERERAVMEQLRTAVEFPGETLIINIEGVNSGFGRQFAEVAQARII
jgi:Zn-dependent protease with chaperone function